ncbi:MAG: PEP-CTERM sorting domain-containing protein [Bythopirellula sp.]|nr:PEP-CTERM sorting domain-containing protein [Bythopirellula sp.]
MNQKKLKLNIALLSSLAMASLAQADPWADSVVSYNSGVGPALGYTDPAVALGEPTHQSIAFGGYPVTPFSAAGGVTEVVSLGEGGELTIRFNEPVTDDQNNPFGVDLLIFGNSFFNLGSFNNDHTDLATGSTASEGGVVSLSADGINFFVVSGVDADGRFPTLGFSDIAIPFPATASIPTDFTQPVDPSFDVTGLNTAAIVAGYNGSGGGVGIDLATVGLTQITHVKITNPVGSGLTPEIDGFADVRAIPEPATFALVGLALVGGGLWRRK